MILPVYNGARHLAASVSSVLTQSHQDFELLIRDDASTDGSVELLEAFRDPRIRLFRNPSNRGLFPTLNALIQDSKGELVRIWTQDDEMLPGCLERETAFHASHPEVWGSYCASDRIDQDGRLIGKAGKDDTPSILSGAQASELMFYFGPLSGNISELMFKRSVFDRIGMFREDLLVSGDYEFWVRLAGHGVIGRLTVPLVRVREHTGQLSRKPGIYAAFIRENIPIRSILASRLHPDVRPAAASWERRHINIQYAHACALSLLKGDFRSAIQILGLLRKIDSPMPVFLWWIASANGRHWKPRPQFRSFGGKDAAHPLTLPPPDHGRRRP